MGDMVFKPLIESMVWSYSRVEIFGNCPYRWFLTYLQDPKLTKEKKFYAEYGTFMHEVLEKFYKGEIDKRQALIKYLTEYSERMNVAGKPNANTLEKYFMLGKEYVSNLEMLPFEMVEVEKRLNFEINGLPFIGVIDYLGKDSDGNFVIVDNKSRELKPRSNRKTPTKKDEELDEMLKQLYIYAHAVKQIYGAFPKYLCFNCFKNGNFIKEEFKEDVYNEVIRWITNEIRSIMETEDFYPNRDFFQCYYLCGMNEYCEYDQEARMSHGRK